MADTLWLTRIAPASPTAPPTLRARTDGSLPTPTQHWEPIADPFEQARLADADPWSLANEAPALDQPITLLDHRLLPPVAPSKIIGIGRNYAAHAAELGNEVPTSPLSFFKPPSSLLASGQPLVLPRGYERIDMEAELVVVIGRRARSIAAARAWDHVAGYLMGNDVSCRDLQRSDKQWTRAKGFDGFAPVSAFLRMVAPGTELPGDLRVQGYLDDRPVQDAAAELMIFSIPTLIEHLSACMTLEPGDLIFTGTPEGVSPLSPGQIVRVAGSHPTLHLAPVVNPIV
ncbi:MAG: fumarylacetoacetate hydrolase family protein [Myxococcales bacterium]|nr:fumarylacetoacetate hydrolase family protein [Myxococcales bacterium]